MTSLDRVLTDSVNFNTKRQENQNLVPAIVLCRKFKFLRNYYMGTSKKKRNNNSNVLFLSKINVHLEPVYFYTYIEKEFISRNFVKQNEKKLQNQNLNRFRRW